MTRALSALRVTPPLALALVLLCSGSSAPGAGQRAAILLSANLEIYDDAIRGFEETFDHEVVAERNMRGDFDRGRRIVAKMLEEVRPDLILAVGVWALELLVQESVDVPIVYAMVLNPPATIGTSAGSITGASMNVPVERVFDVLRQLGPEIRRVGAVFDPSHTGFLIPEAREAARAQELELVVREARSSGEAVSALDALRESGIDAIWILPDKTVLAPKVVEHMLLSAYRERVPLLGLSQRHARMGALAALSFASSRDIGRQAGELANRFIKRGSGAKVPYTKARQLELTLNLKTARKIGIEVPKTVVDQATKVIQ
jgi:putative ABC transport system substrate-binding protein